MVYKAPGSGREGSSIMLIAADGSILLQQRDDDVAPAGVGRWTPPGGGREEGEDPRATALREFEEETSVKLTRLRFFETVTPQEVPELSDHERTVIRIDDVFATARLVAVIGEISLERKLGFAVAAHCQ